MSKWPPQPLDLSTVEHHWNVVEQEKGIMDMQLINLKPRHNVVTTWMQIFRHLPSVITYIPNFNE